MTTATLFWGKVNKNGPVPEHQPDLGPCWVWTGARNPRGCGHLKAKGKYIDAHVWAWVEENGPVPPGLQLDHLCRNVSCVRPRHLEPVTGQVNTRRWADTVTHCPQGHAYDEKNTFHRVARRERHCRACNRDRMRAYRAQKAVA